MLAASQRDIVQAWGTALLMAMKEPRLEAALTASTEEIRLNFDTPQVNSWVRFYFKGDDLSGWRTPLMRHHVSPDASSDISRHFRDALSCAGTYGLVDQAFDAVLSLHAAALPSRRHLS